MAPKYAVDDSEWYEVKIINGYALFMGYLMMGVRGLGLLIITWTTVVLLGGFVSDLGKKDFWCLTGITLIQTAGVFNFLLTEKISDMVHLSWGLLAAAVGTFIRIEKVEDDDAHVPWKRLFLAYAASAIQGVVLFVILCPVSVLYVFGIYIAAGASLWRLIKHDFGNDGDGGANMKPALQVLYSIAVAQGVLFGYKTIHAFVAKTGLVKLVYNALDEQVPKALIEEYLEETLAGCEKDLSFSTGRNLVTYGVDLMMEAKSNEGFIAGIKVLGGAINVGIRGRKVLTKYLLARSDDSSRAIIERLLETVGPRSPYSREIKIYAVRILNIIASCIRLEQFPRAIECLCSVVDTSEESNNDVDLMTYGVDLMMYSKSNEGFIDGIRVLGGAINEGRGGRKVLAKYLLSRSDSLGTIIQRLLKTVGPRSPYSREIKGHVVTILDIIAPCIRLEQFPRAIECLCSVVDTSESNEEVELLEEYVSKFKDYERVELPEEYGSKFKDYERVELLEEYQIDYMKYDLRIDSPKGTLREKLYQCLRSKWLLIQHCLLGKGKEVQNKSKRKENITTNFDWVLIEAVNIIHKLVADEDNLWILRTSVPSTVLHKIASLPIKLHRESHDLSEKLESSRFQMVEKCWEVTERLLVALIETSSPPLLPEATVGEGRQILRRRRIRSKETEEREEQLLALQTIDGSALRSKIKNTIEHSTESAVKCILDSLDCGAMEKRRSIEFLLDLSLDMSTIVKDSESSRRLLWILLLIFSSYFCYSGIRRLVGEKLSEMLREKHGDLPFEESEIELQLIDLALEDLNRGFHDVDISVRTHAVIIMQGLCDDLNCFSEVMEFLVHAIPEVVKETLIHCGSIKAERQEQAPDVEMGNVSQDNHDGCIDTKRLRKALASLCYTYMNNYYRGSNSTSIRSTFEEIASKIYEEQGKSYGDFKEHIRRSTR